VKYYELVPIMTKNRPNGIVVLQNVNLGPHPCHEKNEKSHVQAAQGNRLIPKTNRITVSCAHLIVAGGQISGGEFIRMYTIDFSYKYQKIFLSGWVKESQTR
jgi:hypothetical protein